MAGGHPLSEPSAPQLARAVADLTEAPEEAPDALLSLLTS